MLYVIINTKTGRIASEPLSHAAATAKVRRLAALGHTQFAIRPESE